MAEAASAGCKHPSWCSLSIQIHRRASASCTHAEACGGRRSDRSAHGMYKTLHNQSRCKHRGRNQPKSISWTIVATQPEPRLEHPEQTLRHTSSRSCQCGRTCNPLVPVQDRSARPKPKRQHPKALKRRKRRLRENPDWVKLEPAASCEPPRHQRQYGTEAPNRATAASTQESMPSEEAHPRNAEANRKFELDIAYQRHAILDASSKLPVQGTNADRSRRELPKSESPAPPKWTYPTIEIVRHTGRHNAPSRVRARRWDCYHEIAKTDANWLSRKRDYQYAGWLAIP